MAGTIDKDCSGKNIEKVDKCAAHVNGEHKHQVHNCEKDRQAKPAVQYDFVDLLGHGLTEFLLPTYHIIGEALNKLVATIGKENINLFASFLLQSCSNGTDNFHTTFGTLHLQSLIPFQQSPCHPARANTPMLSQFLHFIAQIGQCVFHDFWIGNCD